LLYSDHRNHYRFMFTSLPLWLTAAVVQLCAPVVISLHLGVYHIHVPYCHHIEHIPYAKPPDIPSTGGTPSNTQEQTHHRHNPTHCSICQAFHSLSAAIFQSCETLLKLPDEVITVASVEQSLNPILSRSHSSGRAPPHII